MSDIFGSDFFAANRERLRQLFTGTAPIVLTAYGMVQKTADEAHEFRQDGNFWYLTGINEPDVILVMDKGREYLIVPERGDWMETSEGAIDFDKLSRISGIATIMNDKEGWKQLGARLKKVQHAATLAANPPYIEVFGMYANPARAALIKRMKEIHGELELLDLRQHLARMRMIKQPVEITAIREAVRVATETLGQIIKPARLAKYAYEYEVEADITHGFRKRGAQGHSFSPVVLGGERACVLHNVAGDTPLSSDELLLIDVGARVNFYCSDITRTVSLNGKPSRRQQAVHRAVLDAQEYAFSLLKPGVLSKDYEREMEQFMGEKLRELGVIKSIESGLVRKYFTHATSHFLGIDTHDGGDYSHAFEPGVVLAVEPGIYIPDEGIGVRIEDNVLITETGCEVLSHRLPREL